MQTQDTIRTVAAKGGYLPASLGFRECADLNGTAARHFLEEAGFNVISSRDCGGYGEAVTAEGITLSTNGYCHLAAEG